MIKRKIIFLIACAFLFQGIIPVAGHAGDKKVLTVAAAASNAFALKGIAIMFERETGTRVRFSFGSTGLLTKQIEQGAPFDMFFSANIRFIKRLEREGFVVPGSVRLYAKGRIVLAVNKSAGIEAKDIKGLLRPGITRVAIANPAHAPYGTAAMEALKSAGVWEEIKKKIVYGENVRQALQFIQSGNAPVGIVALSIAGAPGISYTIIDPALYNPIDQAAAVISASSEKAAAQMFMEYVNGPEGARVLKRYGFTAPD